MDELNIKDFLFVYPDPVTSLDMLTGAAFLYFDKPLLITPPPLVMTNDAFEMLKLVDERNPNWSESLYGMLGMWWQQQNGFRHSLDILSPLKDEKLKVAYTSYNANQGALDQAQEFIESAGYSLEEAEKVINPLNAAGEAIRHIFLESYLENDKNINGLYDYCNNLFQSKEVSAFLTKSYFLRALFISALGQGDISILLTNQNLLPLFDSLPIELDNGSEPWRSVHDVVSWEIFRRIISPRLDPLTPERVAMISELLKKRQEAIKSMKDRCGTLAYDVEISVKNHSLERDIEKIIRSVEPEVSNVLELDKQATQDFIDTLFSDEKTWIFFAVVVSGLVTGELALSAGAAIASFSNIGAKAFKVAAEKRKKIKATNFALLYFLNNP
jgi:hypothetical protein